MSVGRFDYSGWPQRPFETPKHKPSSPSSDHQHLPFAHHPWEPLDDYEGNYGPVSDVKFCVKETVKLRTEGVKQTWFVLLEALVFEMGNDAILQKTAFVDVFPSGKYLVKEDHEVLENAGSGGPYGLIMSDLVLSARNDIIARLPNHDEEGNALLSINSAEKKWTRLGTFRTPSPELVPFTKDVDAELMKYFQRFPDHVTEISPGAFEKIVAEILRSRGFSDIQMNVRNKFGEFDILAFEASKDNKRRGYIVECKHYRHDRKVALREAHVLAAKLAHMKSLGFEHAMLVTTSDFTRDARRLYDSEWHLEFKAFDQVVEWLKHYKPLRDGIHL